MTPDRTGARVPTDAELADMLRFVARTCLEVERGLRPPTHLRALMDPATANQLAEPGKLGRFRGGPVLDNEIGHPQTSRLNDTNIVATVVTRTEADRWGALTLRLRAKDGRWRLADLQRLLAAAHYRAAATATVEFATPPAGLSAQITEERRLAEAAHKATSRRLAELTPDRPGHNAARDLVSYWHDRIGELDRQLIDLNTRQQTSAPIDRLLRR